MAKAQIRTPEGLTIKVDGTPKEIAQVLDRFLDGCGFGNPPRLDRVAD